MSRSIVLGLMIAIGMLLSMTEQAHAWCIYCAWNGHNHGKKTASASYPVTMNTSHAHNGPDEDNPDTKTATFSTETRKKWTVGGGLTAELLELSANYEQETTVLSSSTSTSTVNGPCECDKGHNFITVTKVMYWYSTCKHCQDAGPMSGWKKSESGASSGPLDPDDMSGCGE